jgi:hypothetical protein
VRNAVTSAIEIGGGIAITTGAAQAWSPLGWIVGGLLALAFSRGLTR